jgi:hypothetical protein
VSRLRWRERIGAGLVVAGTGVAFTAVALALLRPGADAAPRAEVVAGPEGVAIRGAF